MTTFADLSHHQAGVSMTAYAAAHDRVALKATEGVGYVDPTFADRWVAAGAAGLARVAYHFDRAASDGGDQCDWFLAAVRRVGGVRAGDLLCLDSEDTQSPAKAAASAAAFTNRAAAAGYRGCVYTGRWFANPYGIGANVLHPLWRRLWLSDYTLAHDDAAMPLPAGWARSQVIARQFTDRAAVPGVTGPCDYSRVLAEWLGAPTPTGDTSVTTEADQILAAVKACQDTLYNLTRAQSPDGKPDPGHAEQAVTTANGRLTALAGALAKIGQQVGALSDDEAKLLAAEDAATAKILAAVQTVIVDPQVPNADPEAFVAALRDALVRGEPA